MFLTKVKYSKAILLPNFVLTSIIQSLFLTHEYVCGIKIGMRKSRTLHIHITTNHYIKNEFLKIENCFLKIIYFDNSKDQTCRTFNIPKLTLRFEYLYLLSFYKLVNNLVPIIDKGLLPDRLNSDTRLAKNHGFRQSNETFRFATANFGAKKFNRHPNRIKRS